MNLWGPLGVLWLELRRSLSVGRFVLWLILAVFPIALIYLARRSASDDVPDEVFVVMLFFLIARVTCVMGLLLWATPLISNEIEGRTWIYIVTRPGGGVSTVWGKYSVSILWSAAIAIVSVPLAVMASGVQSPAHVSSVLTALSLLSCFAYGALFTMIGTIIQKRAMVVAIVYLVLVEGVLTLVPATINKLTVGFRLLALLFKWMGYENREEAENLKILFGESSSWTHVSILALYILAMLTVAILRVRAGGYLTDPDD